MARRHQALCVDLAETMLPVLTDDDFYDFTHMTPQGAKKVGRFLYASLKELNLRSGSADRGGGARPADHRAWMIVYTVGS